MRLLRTLVDFGASTHGLLRLHSHFFFFWGGGRGASPARLFLDETLIRTHPQNPLKSKDEVHYSFHCILHNCPSLARMKRSREHSLRTMNLFVCLSLAIFHFNYFASFSQVGPSWDCQPPKYSITVRYQKVESRSSSVKRWSTYLVETKQLACRVTRKFKHFLWLYDKLAELFPCISLPPLPVKQYSGMCKMCIMCWSMYVWLLCVCVCVCAVSVCFCTM